MSDSGPLLVFNGINGATGRYDIEPMPAAEFAQIALGTAPHTPEEKSHLQELKRRLQRDTQADFAPKEGVDPKKLSETGWGAIFAFGFDPAIREALSPLLALRKQQAGDKYREYVGPDAYRRATADGPGETKQDFLSRHGAGPGPVNPQIVPYYLLIVGDPDTISFRFQYQLDVQYAVGRIHFDTVAEYAAYAESVVAAETGSLALARRAAIFATANSGDAATKLSHDELAAPFADWTATQPVGRSTSTPTATPPKPTSPSFCTRTRSRPIHPFTSGRPLSSLKASDRLLHRRWAAEPNREYPRW
ncbi:MAG: hypothetical protein ACRD27_11915 [Terracidiphilus sp.]